MSDTPISDEEACNLNGNDNWVPVEVARQLELELAEAKANYALAHSELGSYVVLLAEMTKFRDLLANKEMELLKQLTSHKAALEKCKNALLSAESCIIVEGCENGYSHCQVREALDTIAKLKGS